MFFYPFIYSFQNIYKFWSSTYPRDLGYFDGIFHRFSNPREQVLAHVFILRPSHLGTEVLIIKQALHLVAEFNTNLKVFTHTVSEEEEEVEEHEEKEQEAEAKEGKEDATQKTFYKNWKNILESLDDISWYGIFMIGHIV